MVRAPPTPTWHTAHTHRAPTLRSLCFPARLGSPLTLFSRSLCVLRSQVQPKALTNPAVPADQIPALLSTRQDAEHTDHVAGGGGVRGGGGLSRAEVEAPNRQVDDACAHLAAVAKELALPGLQGGRRGDGGSAVI